MDLLDLTSALAPLRRSSKAGPLQGQQRSPSFLLPKQSDRPTSRTLAVGRVNSDRLHPKTSPFCIENVTKTGENVRKENSQLRFAVQPAVLRSARVTP